MPLLMQCQYEPHEEITRAPLLIFPRSDVGDLVIEESVIASGCRRIPGFHLISFMITFGLK
jgi:hypothetical protein